MLEWFVEQTRVFAAFGAFFGAIIGGITLLTLLGSRLPKVGNTLQRWVQDLIGVSSYGKAIETLASNLETYVKTHASEVEVAMKLRDDMIDKAFVVLNEHIKQGHN